MSKCVICGKEFKGSGGSRYCSEKCRNTIVYKNEHVGERFGRLCIISDYKKSNLRYANCKCDCGNTCTVRYDSLQAGNTSSCGCAKNLFKIKDLTGKTNKYGCVAIRPLPEKKEGESGYRWLCRCSCGKEFITSKFYKTQSCGCAKPRSQGWVERTSVVAILPKKMLKNNTSGIRGVTWATAKQKWSAQIQFQGRHFNLGYYDKKEDAAVARKKAEEAVFGNFLEWFKQEYPERLEDIERKNNKNKEEKRIKIKEKTRTIGSIEKCPWCGKDFTVNASTQKYCSARCGRLARLDRQKKQVKEKENMMEVKKVDIEELKKLNFEEGEKLLKSLGYCNNDCAVDDTPPSVDYIEDCYYTLYDEEDEEIDTVSYVRFCNKNPEDPEGLSDFVIKEGWERVE